MVVKQLFLAVPDTVGEVVVRTVSRQQPAVAAGRLKRLAAMRIVADGGSRPGVVHGPNNRFAALQDFPDAGCWILGR